MRATFREAIRDDTLRLEAFLKRRMETSMFLRSNLRDFGIGNTEARHAMRYFLREKGGAIQGVAAIANSGSLMMQATGGLVEICDYMQSVLPEDTNYSGILGDSTQAEIIRDAFGLKDAQTTMDDVEPLFLLELHNLTIPPSNGAILRKPEKQDLPMLNEWGYNYVVETGLREAGKEARDVVKEDIARRVQAGKLRLLVDKGAPVAQTGQRCSTG